MPVNRGGEIECGKVVGLSLKTQRPAVRTHQQCPPSSRRVADSQLDQSAVNPRPSATGPIRTEPEPYRSLAAIYVGQSRVLHVLISEPGRVGAVHLHRVATPGGDCLKIAGLQWNLPLFPDQGGAVKSPIPQAIGIGTLRILRVGMVGLLLKVRNTVVIGVCPHPAGLQSVHDAVAIGIGQVVWNSVQIGVERLSLAVQGNIVKSDVHRCPGFHQLVRPGCIVEQPGARGGLTAGISQRIPCGRLVEIAQRAGLKCEAANHHVVRAVGRQPAAASEVTVVIGNRRPGCARPRDCALVEKVVGDEPCNGIDSTVGVREGADSAVKQIVVASQIQALGCGSGCV